MDYSKHVSSTKSTPQTEAIPGREAEMGRNNAGGVSFVLDNWDRLDRWLILGSEGSTYYVGERDLTKQNVSAVRKCIQEDGVKVVNRIVEISESGRAPKNDPALFALALCAKEGNTVTRTAANQALPKVARIGTHLFHYAQFINSLGGWGSGTVRAFQRWYQNKPAEKLALQAVKYQSRDGWSHRDLLRLSHPKAQDEDHQAIYSWIVKGRTKDLPTIHEVPEALKLIWAFEKAKTASPKELEFLIREYKLPHEAIPTEAKNNPDIWEAMIPDMGITALIRNLGKITSFGDKFLTNTSELTNLIADRIQDEEVLKKGRVHPLNLLVALKIYSQGHGEKGKLSWTPLRKITDALDRAFYLAFKAVEPTGKRILLALDVSGSMSLGQIAGMPITPREATAALALVTANVEKNYEIVGFTAARGNIYDNTAISPLSISPRQRLDDAIKTVSNLPFGRTDCALPMLWATENKQQFDAFVVLTDNETFAGSIMPSQALTQYRQKTGIPAKLVVVGTTATEFTIADPQDNGSLDVVGFDTATPSLISDFIK